MFIADNCTTIDKSWVRILRSTLLLCWALEQLSVAATVFSNIFQTLESLRKLLFSVVMKTTTHTGV